MAKTKLKKEDSTSKKIKELTGKKPEKISEEHLKEVQGIINDINRAQLEIGSFETKKHNMLHHVSSLQEQLSKMQVEFKKNYGTDDINIQDGTINYEKDEQTN